MGTIRNTGPYDCLAKLQANPDMPYFLLLASDPNAPARVRDWADRAEELKSHEPEKIEEARSVAVEMEKWFAENTAPTKRTPPAWPFPVGNRPPAEDTQ